jgi:hypothetical protein
LRTSSLCTEEEGINEFNARMDREDIEAMKVECPLSSCGAQVGHPCTTEDGVVRIRHARRLWIAQKENR